jgi:hypothetical protein
MWGADGADWLAAKFIVSIALSGRIGVLDVHAAAPHTDA